MIATELIATDEHPLTAARAALAGLVPMRISEAETFERVYYDTFDGLLYEAGLTLRFERGRLILERRDGGGEMISEAVNGPLATPAKIEALLPGHMREQLHLLVGVRAINEIARVVLTSSTVAVLDELEKTVVRLQVESPAGMRGRVIVRPLRGYQRECKRVTEALLDSSALALAGRPLVDEAVLMRSGNPGGIRSEVDVELYSQDPAAVAVSRILIRLADVGEGNLPGVLANTDTEFLHDYRVALRRTRAVVREMPGVFPESRYRWLREELKWLQTATGEVRDLDVYLRDFEELRELAPKALQADLEPLLRVLEDRHGQARATMLADLGSDRARALLSQWRELLEALATMPVEDRPDARTPIGELASQRIRKVHRRMVKMGKAIEPSSPPTDYHELRKKGKELRYLLELFGRQLHDPDVVKPMIKALKGLQDVLGHHQDREVQIETLRALADDVVQQPGGARALMAMGALIERLEHDAEQARGEFHERFEAFSSKEQRRLVKETFSR